MGLFTRKISLIDISAAEGGFVLKGVYDDKSEEIFVYKNMSEVLIHTYKFFNISPEKKSVNSCKIYINDGEIDFSSHNSYPEWENKLLIKQVNNGFIITSYITFCNKDYICISFEDVCKFIIEKFKYNIVMGSKIEVIYS